MAVGGGAHRLLEAESLPTPPPPGRMQAGGLSRANPGVELFLNDILIALIFARTFQVFRGTCLARRNAQRPSVLT